MIGPLARASRQAFIAGSTVLAAAIVVSACGVRPEDTLIRDFFAASRLRDLTALSRIATVVFEPRQHGTVAAFTIRSVSAERADGDTVVKDVVIEAPVRIPDGTTVPKTMVVRLQRRAGSPASDPAPLHGGWTVTAVIDAPSVPASPHS